jgi:hypothetical protein
MIQLEPSNESMRDTLFYAIFRDSILFDNIETASYYRRALLKSTGGLRNPPTIFCRSGDRINSEGIMDPKRVKSRRTESAYVFGQLPNLNRAEFKGLEDGLLSHAYYHFHLPANYYRSSDIRNTNLLESLVAEKQLKRDELEEITSHSDKIIDLRKKRDELSERLSSFMVDEGAGRPPKRHRNSESSGSTKRRK